MAVVQRVTRSLWVEIAAGIVVGGILLDIVHKVLPFL